MAVMNFATFRKLASGGGGRTAANVIALTQRLMSDQLTPVLGYRRLVAPDERTAPSFLFESVENGAMVGRHSYIGAQPAIEVIARGHEVTIADHRAGRSTTAIERDPLMVPRRITADWHVAPECPAGSHRRFPGCWVGYAGYDTVRYAEPEKLPFEQAPPSDRPLPDLHFGLYRQMGVFDHVEKVLYAIHHVLLDEHRSVTAAY